MKLETEISKMVDRSIQEFISKIHKKYNISKEELMSVWSGDEEDLSKKSKADLVNICKKLGVGYVGKKKDLIENIKKGHKGAAKLQNDYKVVISKNKYGYYEHSETRFVFNKTDKVVIGKQLDGGDIAELTFTDIEKCNQFNFEYVLPDNLQDIDTTSIQDDVSDNDSDSNLSEFLEDDD